MENYLLKKRFKLSKKKLEGREATYFPIGITEHPDLENGDVVVITGEPEGTEFPIVKVKKNIKDTVTLTVFLKDLSPLK